MTKNLVVVTVEEIPELSLDELCHACGVTPEFIQDLINYGAIEPMDKLRFAADHLRRVQTIVHLQNDLEVNLAGAALALDLMDEMERLRRRVEILEKLFS